MGVRTWPALFQFLGGSAVAFTNGATTTEDIFATIALPGGIMGLNGRLRIATEWTETGSTNTKTHRVRLGGIGGTAYAAVVNGSAAITDLQLHNIIQNKGAANSQSGWGYGVANNTGIFAPARVTSAVDTSVATTLVITGQKALAGETLTLESWSVELLLP
jgi:hypothetical protein